MTVAFAMPLPATRTLSGAEVPAFTVVETPESGLGRRARGGLLVPAVVERPGTGDGLAEEGFVVFVHRCASVRRSEVTVTGGR